MIIDYTTINLYNKYDFSLICEGLFFDRSIDKQGEYLDYQTLGIEPELYFCKMNSRLAVRDLVLVNLFRY